MFRVSIFLHLTTVNRGGIFFCLVSRVKQFLQAFNGIVINIFIGKQFDLLYMCMRFSPLSNSNVSSVGGILNYFTKPQCLKTAAQAVLHMLVCLELVLAFSSDLWHLPISTFSVAVLVGSCFLLLLYCICFTYPRSSAMDITLYRQYEIYRKPCSVTALETAIR